MACTRGCTAAAPMVRGATAEFAAKAVEWVGKRHPNTTGNYYGNSIFGCLGVAVTGRSVGLARGQCDAIPRGLRLETRTDLTRPSLRLGTDCDCGQCSPWASDSRSEDPTVWVD